MQSEPEAARSFLSHVCWAEPLAILTLLLSEITCQEPTS